MATVFSCVRFNVVHNNATFNLWCTKHYSNDRTFAMAVAMSPSCHIKIFHPTKEIMIVAAAYPMRCLSPRQKERKNIPSAMVKVVTIEHLLSQSWCTSVEDIEIQNLDYYNGIERPTVKCFIMMPAAAAEADEFVNVMNHLHITGKLHIIFKTCQL